MSRETFIDQFKKLITKTKMENEKGSQFKINEYTNTIKILEKVDPFDRETILEELKKSGKKNPKKTIEKLDTLFSLGYLPTVKDNEENPETISKTELLKIHGIGPKKADELYKNGINSIEKLSQMDSLTNQQKIGIKYYKYLEESIQRAEIQEFEKKLNKYVEKLIEKGRLSDDFQFSINGSYRRKKNTSNDVDLLTTSKNNMEDRIELINFLKKKYIILDTLSSGPTKFMGIIRLIPNGTPRQIDIIDCSLQEFPFAQLYFTGSKEFCTKIRNIALKKGFTMNERNILKKNKDEIPKEVIFNIIGKSTFETEHDIFKFLDMEYLAPENRL